MKRIRCTSRISFAQLCSGLGMLAAAAFFTVSCAHAPEQPKSAPARPSDIKVEVRDGGPVVLTTSAAEFQVLPSGLMQATLLKDGKRLTLDDPGAGPTSGIDSILHEGKGLQFVPDFGSAKVLEAIGKLGRGKRVEIPQEVFMKMVQESDR